MKKQLILAAIMVLLVCPVLADLVGTLPDVMKPSMITVDNDELYIGEGAVFSVYSLDNLQFLRKFGKKGKDPVNWSSFHTYLIRSRF